MANARRRARRSKAYKTRKFRDAIEGAAVNAVRPTPWFAAPSGRLRRQMNVFLGGAPWPDDPQVRLEAKAKHEADHEADRAKARLRLTKLLRGLAPHNLSWALGHTNDLIRETALTGLATRTTENR